MWKVKPYVNFQVAVMVEENNNKPVEKAFYSHSEIKAIVEIVQWLLIALILALYFRGFVMEAYRIPTGSMATTLKGYHFRLYCRQCGFRFDRDFECVDYDLPPDTLPAGNKAILNDSICPNCHHDMNLKSPVNIASGDRILVLKCLYQFFKPKRWDVITFRDPTEPHSNMIKRLVGLPCETVQIKNGDIYINGRISRKRPGLQQKLWIPVYNNDYQPVRPDELSFNSHNWINPWRNMQGSAWKTNENNKTQFILHDSTEQYHWLQYDSSAGNDFKADIFYNGTRFRDERPYCNDVMVSYYCQAKNDNFKAGAQITRYGRAYRGWLQGNKLNIAEVTDSGPKILIERPIKLKMSKPAKLDFSIVDGFIVLNFAGESASYNLNDNSQTEYKNVPPEIRIFGSGELIYSHLAIYRDIYYTEHHYYGGGDARAAGKNGFRLGKDEYFVLGDNSSASYDSRWWTKSGFGNNGTVYTTGIVPGDYLLGKAVCVYWPSGFRPFEKFQKIIIPNIGQIRFIHGGK